MFSRDRWNELHRVGAFDFDTPDESFVAFLPLLASSGAHSVLDLGCGSGRHARILSANGFEVTALDVSPVALERLRASLPQVTTVLLESPSFPFVTEQFDAVVSINVLHHGLLTEFQRSLCEVERVLKRGGYFFLTVPSREDWKYGEGCTPEPHTYTPTNGTEVGIPHHYFDATELRSCLEHFTITALLEHASSKYTPKPSVHFAVTARKQ